MFSQMVTSADLPGRAAAGPASPPAAGDALGVGAPAVQLGAQLVPLAGGVGGPARAAVRRRRGPGRSRPGRRSRPTVPGWLPALASPARTCSAKSSSQRFRDDEITITPQGQAGADITQRVRTGG